MALDVVDGYRVAITVPAGSTIKVVAGPTGEGDRREQRSVGAGL